VEDRSLRVQKVDTLKLGKKVENKELVSALLESSPRLYSVNAKILSDSPKGAEDLERSLCNSS